MDFVFSTKLMLRVFVLVCFCRSENSWPYNGLCKQGAR